jgi:hypothetical protein
MGTAGARGPHLQSGGMTERWDLGGKRQEYDDAVQAAPGSSGPRTWTLTSPRESVAWLAALRSAP